jgi:hypothetical protein
MTPTPVRNQGIDIAPGFAGYMALPSMSKKLRCGWSVHRSRMEQALEQSINGGRAS